MNGELNHPLNTITRFTSQYQTGNFLSNSFINYFFLCVTPDSNCTLSFLRMQKILKGTAHAAAKANIKQTQE